MCQSVPSRSAMCGLQGVRHDARNVALHDVPLARGDLDSHADDRRRAVLGLPEALRATVTSRLEASFAVSECEKGRP